MVDMRCHVIGADEGDLHGTIYSVAGTNSANERRKADTSNHGRNCYDDSSIDPGEYEREREENPYSPFGLGIVRCAPQDAEYVAEEVLELAELWDAG